MIVRRNRTFRRIHGIRGGFSLIEIVVATAITLLLATLLMSVTAGMLSAWNRSRGKLSSSNQAKLCLDQLANDLESLVMRADGNVWFAASVTGTQPHPGGDAAMIPQASYSNTTGNRCKPSVGSYSVTPISGNILDMRFGHVGVWLRFFANQPSANSSIANVSTVRAISYQLAHVPVGDNVGAGRRYFAFRSAVRPTLIDEDSGAILSEDAGATRSVFTTGYNIVGGNAYNDLSLPDPGSSPAAPARIRRPDKRTIIGNDIIDLGVRIFTRNGGGFLVERFPVDREVSSTTRVQTFLATTNASVEPFGTVTAPTGANGIARGFPAVIEIMVRVLSDEGVQRIRALEENEISPPGGMGNFDSYWWELADTYSTYYTRRIEIKASPVVTP